MKSEKNANFQDKIAENSDEASFEFHETDCSKTLFGDHKVT